VCGCFYPILSIFSGSYYVHGYLTDFASESLFACLQQTMMDAGIYFSQTNSYFYLETIHLQFVMIPQNAQGKYCLTLSPWML